MSDQPSSDAPQAPATPTYPLAFHRAIASDDGQSVFFEVRDAENKPTYLQVPWQNLGHLAHMLNQAGVDAAERRKAVGGSDEFQGVGMAQIVKGFSVASRPERKMKIVSLYSPNGLRSDFALSLDSRDNQGRNFLQALSEELTK